MATGWICGQTARDFIKTKTGMRDNMNIQEAEEFKTSKFFCKTDFDMEEIKKEEEADHRTEEQKKIDDEKFKRQDKTLRIIMFTMIIGGFAALLTIMFFWR